MAEPTLRITEIFHSIQGESTWAGRPCVFVRLTGCHLRCRYCDTEYAFTEGSRRSVGEVVEEVCGHPTKLVMITGGEPLLQESVHELTRRLCDLGKTVIIETSGACDISACDQRAIRIVDLKTPGSGEEQRNDWVNVDRLTPRDEVKFVITDRADYEWAVATIQEHDLTRRCGSVLMSPAHEQGEGVQVPGCEGLAPRRLAEWILADGLDVRLQLQIHKFIWDPQKRGV
ncbi:MAG: radical SAM protein [Phycisphaerales bacterium]|nr:MAG: radical SAM protein [Phycisphaerales bacterium]